MEEAEVITLIALCSKERVCSWMVRCIDRQTDRQRK